MFNQPSFEKRFCVSSALILKKSKVLLAGFREVTRQLGGCGGL